MFATYIISESPVLSALSSSTPIELRIVAVARYKSSLITRALDPFFGAKSR